MRYKHGCAECLGLGKGMKRKPGDAELLFLIWTQLHVPQTFFDETARNDIRPQQSSRLNRLNQNRIRGTYLDLFSFFCKDVLVKGSTPPNPETEPLFCLLAQVSEPKVSKFSMCHKSSKWHIVRLDRHPDSLFVRLPRPRA
jgi:hypothetical protein